MREVEPTDIDPAVKELMQNPNVLTGRPHGGDDLGTNHSAAMIAGRGGKTIRVARNSPGRAETLPGLLVRRELLINKAATSGRGPPPLAAV